MQIIGGVKMTLEEIKKADLATITARSAEIMEMLNASDDIDVEELNAEVDALTERKKEIEIEERKQTMKEVASGAIRGANIIKEMENREMAVEIRNTQEYINAYANYIKTGDDAECRSLLTENATGGTIPVPELVDGIVRTAWDNEPVMARVKKTFLKGNVKIGFEISATDAVIHAEGADAPTEEELKLGIVSLVPETIKKWITVSDEALDLNGEAFLSYIYQELTYKIAKKAADELIAKILAAPTTATATAASVAEVEGGVDVTSCIKAAGLLSDEATAPVVIMNKQTYAAFKSLTTADGYLVADPFDGMEVLFNNSLPVYESAASGEVFAIVGDLATGAQANYPNGEGVQFKYDDLSLAEKDLVKIVGREPVALAVVACGRFTRIKKA